MQRRVEGKLMKELRIARLCSSSQRWCTDRPAPRGLRHLIALLFACPQSLVVFPLEPSVRPGWEDGKARRCCLFCKYWLLVVPHLDLSPSAFLPNPGVWVTAAKCIR
ncbi:hypothetical protein NN561_007120 [Cricetulus griseus]